MPDEPGQQQTDQAPASPTGLIDAVRAGDLAAAERLLAGGTDGADGADIDGRDDNGWSALDWAAGRGDVEAIRLLLDAGADVLATGKEQRTPYQIALAAGHLTAVEVLAAAEDAVDPRAAAGRSWQPYCKAYLLSQLRRFPGWPAGDEQDPDDTVLFLHDDLTVTRSMWRGEDVVFDEVTDEWRRFCADELAFRVPRDVDLVPSATPRNR